MSEERILLVRLSAIGDCLHAVPTLAALRSRHPEVFVGWAIQAAGHELLRGHPLVDRFHVFPRRRSGSRLGHLRDHLSFLRGLRAEGYTVAIDLQGNSKSGFVSRVSGASRRIGFGGEESRELNRFLVNRRLALGDQPPHVVDRNLALLVEAGLGDSAVRWSLPSYEDADEPVRSYLASVGLGERPFAVVNPGTTWPSKKWSREGFHRVAEILAERHRLAVVVTWGSAAEREDAEAIVGRPGDRPIHLAPATELRALAALLGRASLFVGNDTGPLHLAVALGVPCVAVFGATDPRRNGPHGEGHRVLVTEIDCRPCWSRSCARSDLACLERIGAEAVAAACSEVLEQKPAP